MNVQNKVHDSFDSLGSLSRTWKYSEFNSHVPEFHEM
jgi:hypothetical protein